MNRYAEDDEVNFIVCSTITMHHVHGSTPATAACGCPVWLSPTGYAAHMDRSFPTELVCWDHAPSKAIKDLQSNRKSPALKGARQELTRELGIFGGNRLAQQLNIDRDEH